MAYIGVAVAVVAVLTLTVLGATEVMIECGAHRPTWRDWVSGLVFVAVVACIIALAAME